MPSADTDSSELIVSVLTDSNPQPVWSLAWGGTNTIAQALWRITQDCDQQRQDYALGKALVYAIATQDDTVNYGYGTYTAPTWKKTHVDGHGPLADSYDTGGVEEGDSPSFMHLIANGLRSTEDPFFGGWGGRHKSSNGQYYTDAQDDGDADKPMWRWIPFLQNDFQARLDWCLQPVQEANHEPMAVVDGPLDRVAASGSTVTLSAAQSSDPDGHALSFRWWQYADADTATAGVTLIGENSAEVSFEMPQEPGKTVHILLEVTDDGTPKLTRFRRVVVTAL